MAEVFLAMQEGIGGFEKLVVLKRIFQHFCEDEKFVQMFLAEARLAASISHPNVVEILDIQQDANGFFIIMEYLSGETLAFVLDEMKSDCDKIPVPIACRIVADVAAGLHHAHCHTNVDGDIQPIIHRDVTPSNLLICYNGVVKIVDFGVAKALGDPDQSVPGSLKGKLAYLAPEQIRNEQIGPGTDVFQLGVVLHEMLTGEHLFSGENDHFTMNAVLEDAIAPPSERNPDVSPALDAVVLGALARDPAERTESADAMRRAIEDVLTESGNKTSQHDVSDWMHDAFSERLRSRLKLERECTSEMRAGRPSSQMPALAAPFAPTAPVTYGEDTTEKLTVTERPSTQTTDVRSAARRRTHALGGAAVALLAVGALFIWWRSGTARSSQVAPTDARTTGAPRIAKVASDASVALDRPVTTTDTLPPASATPTAVTKTRPAAVPTFEAVVAVEPPTAQIEFDGTTVGTGSFSAVLAQNGTTHRLRVSASGYRTRTIVFTDRPPPATVMLQRLDRKQPRPRPGRKSTSVTSAAGATGVQSTPGGTQGATAKQPGKTPTTTGPGPGSGSTDNIDPWAKPRP